MSNTIQSELIREYEGKTEKEAIDAAVEDLGLGRDGFDVEIIENQRGGFLNMSKKVRIRVHLHDSTTVVPEKKPQKRQASHDSAIHTINEPSNDFEHAICDFMRTLTKKMGTPMEPVVLYREDSKLALRLDGDYAGIIIGRKGKNLDALQVLVNVVSNRLVGSDFKVVLDTENYRGRREEQLIQLAMRTADQVMESRKSRLLEPMNPFERRIIHTALNDINDICTKSEGEGLYKQVRILHRAYQN